MVWPSLVWFGLVCYGFGSGLGWVGWIWFGLVAARHILMCCGAEEGAEEGAEVAGEVELVGQEEGEILLTALPLQLAQQVGPWQPLLHPILIME
jgi:hypothetical protein